MRTGAPRSTAGYLDDASISHTPAVDGVAAAERLGGVLGVPMAVDDEPVGVLLAADRGPRQFTDREVELLGEGWRGPDRSLDIQLALRLRELADRFALDPGTTFANGG